MTGFPDFCVRRTLNRLSAYLHLNHLENDSSLIVPSLIIANRSWAGLGFLGTTVENKGDMFIENP